MAIECLLFDTPLHLLTWGLVSPWNDVVWSAYVGSQQCTTITAATAPVSVLRVISCIRPHIIHTLYVYYIFKASLPPSSTIILILHERKWSLRKGESLAPGLTTSKRHNQNSSTPEFEHLVSLLYHVFPGS